MTRMACMGNEGDTEQAFMTALGQVETVVGTHLMLSLFDADNRLLATLTRRDAD